MPGTSRLYGVVAGVTGHRLPRTSTLAGLALVMWVATLVGRSLPMLAGSRPLLVVVAVACLTALPRRSLVIVFVSAVAAAGGAGEWHQVVVAESTPCAGIALARTDPREARGATSLVLEIDDLRWRVTARGRVGGLLSRVAAGETVRVDAVCERATGMWADRDRVRHVVGRATVTDVSETTGAGSPLSRASNRVRRALVDGTSGVPENLRGLFSGLAVGDDRSQPRDMVDDFRASGISHLTAVSGQNVAYLVATASPLLARLGKWSRLAAVLGLIGWFTVLTRAEPSVVRAAVMAGLVALSGAFGAGLNGRTVLAVTTMVLLVIDPMLAWSVGFALSVGATAGLAWLSQPIAGVLGSRVSAGGVLSSTLAAQAGTAPVLLFVFGSIPAVTLVANPLVIAVAGVVMTVGVPLALVASFVPWFAPVVAACLTPPLWWVATVARVCADHGPAGWANLVAWGGVAWWFAHRVRTSRMALRCGKVDAWPHG